jgi:hypothetical protein
MVSLGFVHINKKIILVVFENLPISAVEIRVNKCYLITPELSET